MLRKRDADVDAADVGVLIEDAGALKFAERIFEVLAVHQCDAVIIFPDHFGAGVLGFGGMDGFSLWARAVVPVARR